VRGYPHGILPQEARATPSGLFQYRALERWASERGTEIVGWLAIGEDASRPLRPSNPGLTYARLGASMKKSSLVMDSVLRLYDGATPESATELTAYLQDTNFPVFSAAHDCMVHAYEERFELVLADRLVQINERSQRSDMKAELAKLGFGKKPRATPGQRQEKVAAHKASESAVLSIQIGKITSKCDADELPLELKTLCEELNKQGVLTKTGKPWALPNLRKRLKIMRAAMPHAPLWQHVKV
jgi:hypothetical protein